MNGKKVDKHNNLTQYHKITKPSRKHFLECFVIYYLIIIWFLFFEPSLASLPSLHINGNCNLLLPAFLRRKRHHMTFNRSIIVELKNAGFCWDTACIQSAKRRQSPPPYPSVSCSNRLLCRCENRYV